MISLNSILKTGAVALLLSAPIAANATTVTWSQDGANGLGTCSVSDLTGPADKCFGSLDPDPKNDNKVDFNNDMFNDGVTTTTGIFGLTGWVELGKEDTPGGLNTGGSAIGLNVTPKNNVSSGSWEVTIKNLGAFDDIIVVLKAGSDFVAYLFNDGDDAESGDWTTAGLDNKGLSHFSIYGRGQSGTCDPFVDVCDPPVGEVPLPAGMVLMLSALGLGGIVARRRRS